MRRRIAVLMGGVSAEREISLRSGRAIAVALGSRGHVVTEVDIRTEDVSPYTGSDPQASRAGMDKMASKCFFVTHDVPTPSFRLVTSTQEWSYIAEAIEEMGFPLVVKPLRQGSSIGVSMVHEQDAMAAALSRAFKYGHHALLERFVPGREFTVGMLGEQPLPVIELRPRQAFFDYEAKYVDAKTEFITQPEISRETYERLQEVAAAAHTALGCRHVSRVDLMLESDGCIQVLEVNTIPGCTERSLLPLAAREAGMGFGELCERIVEMALAEQLVAVDATK